MSALDKFIKGTCTSMCALHEIELREEEGLLHFLEMKAGTERKKRPQADYKKVVKAYQRSAAGQRMPKPSDLRPIGILNKTVRYLLSLAYNPPPDVKEWVIVYEFVADRLRAVRQDMVIQGLISGADSLLVLEAMVLFHIYAGYRLSEQKMNVFDPKINGDLLLDSLKRCLSLYDLGVESNNQGLMEAIYALVALGNSDALHRLSTFHDLSRCEETNIALSFSLAFLLGNFVRAFRLLRKMSPVLACAAAPHTPVLRRRALQVLSVAYNSKVLTIPASAVASWLQLTSEAVLQLCAHHGLVCKDGNISFQKANFNDIATMGSCRKLDFLDEKLENSDIKSILMINFI